MLEISWVFIALGAWLIALAFLTKKFNHPKRKLPPGPRPWRIIGNLNLLGSLPHESLHHLSQKYGDLMLLKFGSKPVLIASSLEMAKEILKTHDAIFASRPALAAGKYTSFNYSDITWAPYGAYWRHARKIYLTEVFNPKSLDSLEYIRIEERRILSDKYFSDHYDQSNSDASIVTFETLQQMLDEWFFFDTSAATIEWGSQELLRIPNIIEKAHQELDRAIGKERWVEEKDFSQLPYIDAIIKETFRLHPLCALLPPHYSTEDFTVAGYDIPKGTAAYINVWSIGRNSKYWDRPEEFIPERFIENNRHERTKLLTIAIWFWKEEVSRV
ncbi:putative cytochrome 71A1-like [Capsicum annuum]|nr:putative cytochrome 71A1-like [Capsicum annuum]